MSDKYKKISSEKGDWQVLKDKTIEWKNKHPVHAEAFQNRIEFREIDKLFEEAHKKEHDHEDTDTKQLWMSAKQRQDEKEADLKNVSKHIDSNSHIAYRSNYSIKHNKYSTLVANNKYNRHGGNSYIQ